MRWSLIVFSAAAIAACGTGSVSAQFDELARNIPSSANAVAFVNVEKLMASPAAKKGNWADKRDAAFASGVSFLPPDSKQAVLAMQLDLQMWLPLWEAAILEIDHEPSIEKVVEMTGGSADNVGGRPAVGLPEDAYLVKLGKSTAAFMAPASRQSVARWMREVDGRRSPALSPYLTEAYQFANEIGTPVILAMDLEDTLPLDAIKARLEEPENKAFLAENKLQVDAVAKMLSGIRGITLGITFADKPFGKIKVDFRDNVTLTPAAAKAALLLALGNHGAMIDEFREWKPGVSGKQVTLEGYLEASGMRRISTLFDRPPSLKPRELTAEESAQSKEQLVAQASQKYFKRVNELLDDLKETKDRSDNYTWGQIGVWMDKYAKKIDQLSVLNVDQELVEYGAHVSDLLRSAYGAIRTGAARSRVRQVNTQMQYNYYSYGTTYGYTYRDGDYGAGYVPYGNYGTVAVPDQLAYQHERTRARTEERVTSANQARDIVQEIKAVQADMRRKMTQKYNVDF